MTLAGVHLDLAQSWPRWLSAAGAVAAAAGWWWLYRISRSGRAVGIGGGGMIRRARVVLMAGVRVALAAAGAWLAFHALTAVFLLAVEWALPVALLAAGAAEGLIWLYRLERRIVPARTGALLTGLRLGLLAVVALMLVQPVFVSVWSRTRKRTLAVLVDASASMRIADRQLGEHEKLRLAEAFSVDAARRSVRLEDSADQLRAVQARLAHELAWLDRLAQGKTDTAQTQLAQRRKGLHETFTASADALAEQIETLQSVLDEFANLEKPLAADLLSVKGSLSARVRPRLLDAGNWTHGDQAERLVEHLDRLRGGLGKAVEELAKAPPLLERVGRRLDESLYRQLAPADRRVVDAVAGLPRLELAKSALLHRPREGGRDEPGASLLSRFGEQYNVKVYTFAAGVAEADAGGWSDTASVAAAEAARADGPSTRPAGAELEPAADLEQIQRTDLSAALGKVLADVGGEDLAAVVAFSDGQDNGKLGPEPLARQLGGQGVPFCAVVMGGEKPPVDAAIISVEAPEAVYLADRMFINTELKLDGLAGKEVRVTLLDGKRPVDFKTVRVAGDVFRTRIQLADEPKKVGLHDYCVEIDPREDEVFTDNNRYRLTLSVTDDKTKVLLVDSRPRWEFRYLRNLFTGRDKTVRLQYVLLRPDKFFGQPPRPKVHASVKRPGGQEEATALPETEQDWLKFDVIFLGDVAAEDLSDEQMRILRRFVADRGGTLILIAGPEAMPADYAATALAELIPVRLEQSASRPGEDRAAANANASPPRGFRVALTPEGADHVICRQDVDADKSRQVWQSVPPVYWRSRFTEAKPAATVLAYALDPGAPEWLSGKPAGTEPSPRRLAERREEYQRKHGLIFLAPHGLGKVMLLSFDRTWRLRYRRGDTYHHKFWGQVLRWATAGKLPVGSHLVKLGTDKTRYPPHARPVVRAKIVREDFSPVITDQVAIKVFSDGKSVARVPMRYLKDSPGMYVATLDELPAGTYRLELESPEAEALLKREGMDKLSAEISVDPSTPAEQIELAANRHLLGRLAGLSHDGMVVAPQEARRLLERLPPGKIKQTHRRQFALWDSWVLLGLFCALASAEWLLRKQAGLA